MIRKKLGGTGAGWEGMNLPQCAKKREKKKKSTPMVPSRVAILFPSSYLGGFPTYQRCDTASQLAAGNTTLWVQTSRKLSRGD
jgi:hypothetical protein